MRHEWRKKKHEPLPPVMTSWLPLPLPLAMLTPNLTVFLELSLVPGHFLPLAAPPFLLGGVLNDNGTCAGGGGISEAFSTGDAGGSSPGEEPLFSFFFFFFFSEDPGLDSCWQQASRSAWSDVTEARGGCQDGRQREMECKTSSPDHHGYPAISTDTLIQYHE